MFGEKHAELPQGANYIKPGISEVEIVNITKPAEESYFVVTLKNKGENNDTAKDFRFYTTEKAINLNMNKFYEIVRAVVGDKANDIVAQSLEEYLAAVTPMLVGRSYFQKFSGREYVSDNGVKIATDIPLSNRTQKNPIATVASATGAELSFSEEKDIKRLESSELPDNQSDAPGWD